MYVQDKVNIVISEIHLVISSVRLIMYIETFALYIGVFDSANKTFYMKVKKSVINWASLWSKLRNKNNFVKQIWSDDIFRINIALLMKKQGRVHQT